MKPESMKNIIVLKDLPSNIVDEAFVILKSNKKIKSLEHINQGKEEVKCSGVKNEDYIIKEAEMVVNNFLSKVEKEKEHKSYSIKQIELKYKKLKMITAILASIIVIDVIFAII